jgi:uncharacterized protein YbaP (TraB family)
MKRVNQTIKLVVLLVFGFVLLFNSTLNAQLLWEISGNGLKKKSYLYGTLHVAPKKEFYLNNNVPRVMKECDVLAIETIIKFKDVINLAPMMTLDNGRTIRDYMSVEDFNRLHDYCLNTLKMKENRFNRYLRLKPLFISSDLLIGQLGKTKSVEKELEKMAKKNKMSLVGLESVEYQFEVISKMPVEAGFAQLVAGLGEELTEFYKLMRIYQKEDLDELYRLTVESDSDMPGFVDLLLNTRNKNWIPVIQGLTSEQAVFIAVGAAHLPGDLGVINLLKQEGFILTPIR